MWNNGKVADPTLPLPKDFGWEWKEDDKKLISATTRLPPAPNGVIHLVRCKKSRKGAEITILNAGNRISNVQISAGDLTVHGDECKNELDDDDDDSDNDDDDDDDDDMIRVNVIRTMQKVN